MKVAAIHIAPGRRLPMRPVDDVVAEAGKGLVGDGIGPGAAAALRGRARTVFRVLTSGTFGVGDPVEIIDQ